MFNKCLKCVSLWKIFKHGYMEYFIIIPLFLLTVLVALFASSAYYRHKYRSTIESMKGRISDLQELVGEKDSNDTTMNTNVPEESPATELYQKLTDVIRREHLFLRSDFERKNLMDTFHLPKERIGAAFSTSGTSLPEFIRDCRLEYARNLITEQPAMTFADIARSSGFIHASTFSVDFKNKFGVSPTQYREMTINEIEENKQ